MNVISCQNGHFYDGDKFSVCPHCGAPAGGATVAKEPEKTVKKPLFFGRKNKSEEKQVTPSVQSQNAASWAQPQSVQPQSVQPVSDPVPQQSTPEQVAFTPTPSYIEQINNRAKSGKTLDFWQTSPVEEDAVQESVPLVNDILQAASQQAVTAVQEPLAQPEINIQSVQTPPVQPIQKTQPVEEAPRMDSLREAIQKASASTEGKTVGVFSMGNSAPTTSTPVSGVASVAPSAPAYDGPVDPVVGWLVCIHGKHFGESFNIAAGKNSIGRSASNHIILWKDNSVSREKHAMVIYEPKKRNFYVQPGDSSGLTYLNDDYITESKRLTARDILEIGDCQFVFIPLCGEDFTWEDYISKE